ncbi:putative helicase with zinc finger domain, partial [Acropora cervicornis]
LEEDRQRHEFKEGEENLIIFTQVSVTVTSEGYLKLVFKSVVEEFVTCWYKLVGNLSCSKTIQRTDNFYSGVKPFEPDHTLKAEAAMAVSRLSPYDVVLSDLPFPIPRNYLTNVFRECEMVKSMLNGKLDEHTAFLLLRAHELQGEMLEAFQYAIIYKYLEQKMTRDKGAFSRLRGKVIRLCGLGFKGHSNQYYIGRFIDGLMRTGDDHFLQESFALASCIYSEVLSNFEVVDAFEQRARCYLFLGNLQNAKEDCTKVLDMTGRQSVPALEILTEIKTRLEEFKEALDLVKELQRLHPGNIELYRLEKDLSEKLREKQDSKKLRQSQSVTHYSGSYIEPQKSTSKVPIRASKQSSGAKRKTKKELRNEEKRREKEREQIAQEIKQKEMERKLREEDKARRREEDNQHCPTEVIGGSVVNKIATTDEAPSGSASSKPRFPERTRKRKVRRKTRNLRAKRAAELAYDSDASSVCSINTSPGDLFHQTDPQFRPKMPTWDEKNFMSDVPKSSFNRNEQHKQHKPVDSVRRRPPGVFGPYQLCWQNKRKQGCNKGKTCLFAHSEKERKAWEEDRKKVSNKKTKTTNASSTSNASSLLKEFRVAFRGPANCRAPLRILQNGAKYRMCPNWKKGTCKLNKACTYAHGDDELNAWNEHLEKMNQGSKGESETKITKPKNDERATISLPKEKPVKRPAPNYKLDELVSRVAGVTVTSEPEELAVQLQIPLNSQGSTSHCWKIRVDYESQGTGHLQDVILLPQHHKCFTLSSINIKCTTPSHSGVPVEVELTNDLHYAVEPHLRSLNGIYQAEVVVTFSALVFGSFSQVLVLDFGRDSAHLSVIMNVEVGSQEFLEEYGNEKCKLSLDGTLWDDGSRNIVKFEPKQASTFSNDDLLDAYKLPKQEEMVPSALLDKSQGLRPHNYEKVMHQLLFVEEVYIRKQIARSIFFSLGSYNFQNSSYQTCRYLYSDRKKDCMLNFEKRHEVIKRTGSGS